MIRRLGLAIAVVLAGCASNRAGGNGADASASDAPVSDAGGCAVQIMFDPPQQIAPTSVRAIANVPAQGAYAYTWTVIHDGTSSTPPPATIDGSQVMFPAPDAGIYDVRVTVTGGPPCDSADVELDVAAAGANQETVRVRATPPASIAPPQEWQWSVSGGADAAFAFRALTAGSAATGAVVDGAGHPVTAYLRFSPVSGPGTPIEAFTAADGTFMVTVLAGITHDVMIVPTIPGYAPTIVREWMPAQTTLTVGAGTAIAGTVVAPGGAPVVGAKVQLELGTVPTTAATTDASGAFTVAGDLALLMPPGATPLTVEVVAPPASGLPRLTASAASFDLTQPVQIRYAPALVLRDLGGVAIRRGGAPVGDGTAVGVVGTLPAGGTVTTGATAVPATGTVLFAATTTGGTLPAGPLLVPGAPLSAVIEAGGASVTAIDLTAAVPPAIDSVAPQLTTGTVADASGAALGSVALTATGDGPLALAGAPPVTATTAGDGTFALALAAGGSYDVRAIDPQARAAPGTVAGVVPSATPLAIALPATIHLIGSVGLQDPQILASDTAIEILCNDCAGVAADLPLGVALTNSVGGFTVAIPDPGVVPLIRRSPDLANVTRWMSSGWWSRLLR